MEGGRRDKRSIKTEENRATDKRKKLKKEEQ